MLATFLLQNRQKPFNIGVNSQWVESESDILEFGMQGASPSTESGFEEAKITI